MKTNRNKESKNVKLCFYLRLEALNIPMQCQQQYTPHGSTIHDNQQISLKKVHSSFCTVHVAYIHSQNLDVIKSYLHAYHWKDMNFGKIIFEMTDQATTNNQEVELKTIYREQAVQVHFKCTFVDHRFWQPMQTLILLF